MFKIEQFLSSNGIDYITSGTNVKKGNINIDCPFCNLPVTHHSSHHLGINPINNYWACWRNKKHRGKRPHRLIMKLVRCSYIEARRILGDTSVAINEATLTNLANGVFFSNEEYLEYKTNNLLVFNYEFRFLDGKYRNAESKFLDYLICNRGFSGGIEGIIKKYGLMYSINGEFKDRVVMPLFLHNRVVSWTSRSIHKGVSLRYKHLDTERSFIPPKDFIYNYDNAIKGGDLLFIVEGPFDVIPLDYYSYENVSAVGIFNMTCEETQAYWLKRLAQKFKRIVILLDRGELASSHSLFNSLFFIEQEKLVMGSLEMFDSSIRDPGELNLVQVLKMCKNYMTAI